MSQVKIEEQIIAALKKKETVTFLAPPMVSSRQVIKRVGKNIPSGFISFSIDTKALTELSLSNFYQLILRQISKTPSSSTNPDLLLEKIKKVVLQKAKTKMIVLMFNNMELLLPLGAIPFLNLQSLREESPDKILFIFYFNQNILSGKLRKRLANFPFLFENIFYLPLTEDFPKNLIQAKNFYYLLLETERRLIRQLVHGDTKFHPVLAADVEYLLKTKILTKTRGKFKVTNPFLVQVGLEAPEANQPPPLKTLLPNFSPQEQKVLKQLFKNKGGIVERERIARRMWNKDWTEKYSDWAIDQLISRIRQKLKTLWINPSILQTHKKKGVSLKATGEKKSTDSPDQGLVENQFS